MRSVADRLRAEDHAAALALPASDRIALALALGARDLESFRLAQDPPLDPAAAARMLDRRRQAGRRPSRCIQDDRLSLLRDVAAVLRTRGIAFAIVGAGAMAVHGVTRGTRDLDILTLAPECLVSSTWTALPAPIEADIRRGDAQDPLAGVVRFTVEGEQPVDLVVGKSGWQREILARLRSP